MAQYLKPDCALGYVDDNAEIENLKINNLRHVVLGCMLGDFDEVGNYVVAPEIVNELISMEKYIVQTYDNIELCKSVIKLDKQISFMVAFEGNKATLSLVEKLNYEANFSLNSGTYSNINEYVLDVVETNGEVNRNVIYSRWNIKSFPGQIIDIFNCDESILSKYFGVVNRFKYLLEANKILLEKEEEMEEIEASYASDLLDVLAHYPKLKKEVIATIKETLTEKKESVSIKKPFFAKTFNEVLENAIHKNIALLEEKEKVDFLQERRNALVALNVRRQDVLEVSKNEVEQVGQHQTSPKVIVIKTVTTVTQSKNFETLGREFLSTLTVVEKGKSDEVFVETRQQSSLVQRTMQVVITKKGGEASADSRATAEHKQHVRSAREGLLSRLEESNLAVVVGAPVKVVVAATPITTTPSTTVTTAAPTKKPPVKVVSSGNGKGPAKKGPAKKGPAKKGPAKAPAQTSAGNSNTPSNTKSGGEGDGVVEEKLIIVANGAGMQAGTTETTTTPHTSEKQGSTDERSPQESALPEYTEGYIEGEDEEMLTPEQLARLREEREDVIEDEESLDNVEEEMREVGTNIEDEATRRTRRATDDYDEELAVVTTEREGAVEEDFDFDADTDEIILS